MLYFCLNHRTNISKSWISQVEKKYLFWIKNKSINWFHFHQTEICWLGGFRQLEPSITNERGVLLLKERKTIHHILVKSRAKGWWSGGSDHCPFCLETRQWTLRPATPQTASPHGVSVIQSLPGDRSPCVSLFLSFPSSLAFLFPRIFSLSRLSLPRLLKNWLCHQTD